jgi:hypothetical protein
MNAIETVYRGYRFRSRLEARWAVFFDALGLRWEFEKEGYELDGVRYLPDFWLADLNLWAEVKPEESTEGEDKLRRLVEAVPSFGVMLRGAPDVEKVYDALAFDISDSSGGMMTYQVQWRQCVLCSTWTLTLDDSRRNIVDCRGEPLRRCKCADNVKPIFGSDLTPLALAVAESRGARFEFGESRGVL